MKISELIQKLENAKEFMGDVNVFFDVESATDDLVDLSAGESGDECEYIYNEERAFVGIDLDIAQTWPEDADELEDIVLVRVA